MIVVWLSIGIATLLLATLAGLAWGGSSKLMARRIPDPKADPTDYGLAYKDVSFRSRDGLTLRGWFIPANSSAHGTVIFCHGHAGSMDPDIAYVPWFNAAGFNVLMFDFRAHGRSEGDRVSLGYFECQDLLGAIDYLQSQGITEVGVMGFSMGGAVGLVTAAQNEAIRAAISDGGFARLESAVLGWGLERGLPRWLAFIIARLIITVTGWRLGVRITEADPIRWVARIAPRAVLFIHGDQDPFVTIADVEALYAKSGKPKALWRVAEAQHRR
ncbi:MAG: alpha/beta fold hydrolase, partial [Anaerolineae bacterium]|nr:alpha/beta fold hydrolase [Anaerolineae bacterium]